MVESISACLISLGDIGTLPLYEGVTQALHAAVVLGAFAVATGLGIASLLARPWRASPSENPQAACHLHDWLRLDDGGFVCLRCSYRAAASFVATRARRH